MANRIAIIAEHQNGEILPVTYELLGLADKIKDMEPLEICFFVMGEDIQNPCETISRDTGQKVHGIHVPGLSHFNGEIYKKLLSAFFLENPFDYILICHSSLGMDYAPALSAALKGACITGVKDVVQKDGTLCFIRSMFGGKLSAALNAEVFPVVITLQPGALKAFCPNTKETGPIEKTVFEIIDTAMIYKGTRVSPFKGSGLARADVVISGGRGIRDAKNYEYIELLAGLFPRSATGGSRPICDYKWINYGKQVGITGATVSPKLYIACGISGAPQHIEAIRGAGFIVAVNIDPDAPIFQMADVCIVDDLIEFIPLFIKTVKKKRRNKDEGNNLGDPLLD